MSTVMFLVDFSPIKPDFGLLFWTSIIFILFWMILAKFAFRPIANALKTREDSITEALDKAEKAKEEMARLQSDNERILQEAREERSRIIREAKETGDRLVNDSKSKAKEEADKIVANARQEITSQKQVAMLEVKNMVGLETIALAEKVLRRELKDKPDQESFLQDEVKKINLN